MSETMLERSRFRLPALALRQRSNEHPLIMFTVLVGLSFAAMVVASHSGFASTPMTAETERGLSTAAADEATTPKTARLALSDADIACDGQAWGSQSADCLATIAKASGRTAVRQVRLIGAAPADGAMPNTF